MLHQMSLQKKNCSLKMENIETEIRMSVGGGE